MESSLVTLDKDDETYKTIENELENIKHDTKIFAEARRVMDKEQIYKTDGLVFTPVNLIIGDEQDGSLLYLVEDGTNFLNGNRLKKHN